jgi:hypothetical protein
MPVRVSQILPPPVRVPMGEHSLEVRGLTLPEVVSLITNYRTDFMRLLVLARAGMPNFVEIMEIAPKMVEDILCYATNSKGDDAEEDAVAQLPAGVQLIALTEIWKLTVTDQKKIQGLLSEAMAELRKHLPPAGKSEPTSEDLDPKNGSSLNSKSP